MPSKDLRRQSRRLAWFQGPEADALCASEQAHLGHAIQAKPRMPAVCVSARGRPGNLPLDDAGQVLWLNLWHGRFSGDIDCAHPWPLPSESVGTVVIHHATDVLDERESLFGDAHRVLVPGGQLFVFALNPLSPWRRWWWRESMRSVEPSSLRRDLRAQGFHCDTVTRGLGPTWQVAVREDSASGAGARAAFVLHAEKRVAPLTPVRGRNVMRPAYGKAA